MSRVLHAAGCVKTTLRIRVCAAASTSNATLRVVRLGNEHLAEKAHPREEDDHDVDRVEHCGRAQRERCEGRDQQVKTLDARGAISHAAAFPGARLLPRPCLTPIGFARRTTARRSNESSDADVFCGNYIVAAASVGEKGRKAAYSRRAPRAPRTSRWRPAQRAASARQRAARRRQRRGSGQSWTEPS